MLTALICNASIFPAVMDALVVACGNWWASKPEEPTGPRAAHGAWQVHISMYRGPWPSLALELRSPWCIMVRTSWTKGISWAESIARGPWPEPQDWQIFIYTPKALNKNLNLFRSLIPGLPSLFLFVAVLTFLVNFQFVLQCKTKNWCDLAK